MSWETGGKASARAAMATKYLSKRATTAKYPLRRSERLQQHHSTERINVKIRMKHTLAQHSKEQLRQSTPKVQRRHGCKVHQRSLQEEDDIHGRHQRWEKRPRGTFVSKLAHRPLGRTKQEVKRGFHHQGLFNCSCCGRSHPTLRH